MADADIDAAHLLMGIAMAGMLVASLTTLPNDVWDVIFAVMTAWFGWCRLPRVPRAGCRGSGRQPPLTASGARAAMLYMFVADRPPVAGHGAGMAGMGGGSGSDADAERARAGVPVRAASGRVLRSWTWTGCPVPHAHGRTLLSGRRPARRRPRWLVPGRGRVR